MFAFVVAKVTILVALLLAQPSRSSSWSVEDSTHYCGPYSDGSWGKCDADRCCGRDNYCTYYKNCDDGTCQYYCTPSPSPNGADGEAVVEEVLVNATRNEYYSDRQIDGIKPGGDEYSSSSSASVGLGLLSCARSLSGLSPAARRRYPWAALGVAAARSGNGTAAVCGRCLKVTNVGAGGGDDVGVKVRIVHVHEIEGLELDGDTFRELVDVDGGRAYGDRVTVKYQFEDC